MDKECINSNQNKLIFPTPIFLCMKLAKMDHNTKGKWSFIGNKKQNACLVHVYLQRAISEKQNKT